MFVNMLNIVRNLIKEVKAYRRLSSLFTLSLLPRFIKVLIKLGIISSFPAYVAIAPDGTKILYEINSGIRSSLSDIYLNREYFKHPLYIPREGDVIVDCGAFVGLYSILVSKICKNNCRIIAIEPAPTTFKLLQENIKLNNVKNIKAFNVALANHEGRMEFLVPKVSTAVSGASTFYQNHLNALNVRDYFKITVNVTTLDNLINNEKLDHVDILKVDVEGAEILVLEGAKNLLRNKKISKLIIEIHKTINEPCKIINIINDFGYIIDAYLDINKFKGMLYARKRS